MSRFGDRILNILMGEYMEEGENVVLVPKGSSSVPRKETSIRLEGRNINFLQVKSEARNGKSRYGYQYLLKDSGASFYVYGKDNWVDEWWGHTRSKGVKTYGSSLAGIGKQLSAIKFKGFTPELKENIYDGIEWFLYSGDCEFHYITTKSRYGTDKKVKTSCSSASGKLEWKGGLADQIGSDTELNEDLVNLGVEDLRIVPDTKGNCVRIVHNRKIFIEAETLITREGERQYVDKKMPTTEELDVFDRLAEKLA